jgi:hypothetical protein
MRIQIPRSHQLRGDPGALRFQKRFVTHKVVVGRYEMEIYRSEPCLLHEQRQLPSNARISTVRPARPSVSCVEIAKSGTVRPGPLVQIEVIVEKDRSGTDFENPEDLFEGWHRIRQMFQHKPRNNEIKGFLGESELGDRPLEYLTSLSGHVAPRNRNERPLDFDAGAAQSGINRLELFQQVAGAAAAIEQAHSVVQTEPLVQRQFLIPEQIHLCIQALDFTVNICGKT